MNQLYLNKTRLVCLCLIVLLFSGCAIKHTSQPTDPDRVKNKYPAVYALQKKLAADTSALDKQLIDVRKKFELVYLAYEVQKATIADLVRDASRVGVAAGSFIAIGGKLEYAEKQEVEMALCLRALNRCLGRSQTYEDGAGCFSNYRNC